MKNYSGFTPLLCLVVFCFVTTVYGQGTVTAAASARLAGKDSQPLATFGAVYPVAVTADAYILETCAHVAVNDCRRRVYDGRSFHMDGGRAERYRAAYVDCEHDVALFAVDKREFDGPLQTFKFARKPLRKGDVLTYRSLFTGKTVTGRMVDVDGCAIVVKFEQDGRRGARKRFEAVSTRDFPVKKRPRARPRLAASNEGQSWILRLPIKNAISGSISS